MRALIAPYCALSCAFFQDVDLTVKCHMSQSDLVTIKNLRFSRSQRVIFDDIDLHVPKGKVTAIMGLRESVKPHCCV